MTDLIRKMLNQTSPFEGLVKIKNNPSSGYDIRANALSTDRTYQQYHNGRYTTFTLDSNHFCGFYLPKPETVDISTEPGLDSDILPCGEVVCAGCFYALGVINVADSVYSPTTFYESNLTLSIGQPYHESLYKIFEHFTENYGGPESPLEIMAKNNELTKISAPSIYGNLVVYVENKLQIGGFVYGFIHIPHDVAPLKLMMLKVFIVKESLACQSFLSGSILSNDTNGFVAVSSEDEELRLVEFTKYVRNSGAVIEDDGTISKLFKNEDDVTTHVTNCKVFLVPVYPNETNVLNEPSVEIDEPSQLAALRLDTSRCPLVPIEKKPKTFLEKLKDFFTF